MFVACEENKAEKEAPNTLPESLHTLRAVHFVGQAQALKPSEETKPCLGSVAFQVRRLYTPS